MKKKHILFIISLFIINLICFSCLIAIDDDYFVEIYDENDKPILDILRVKDLNLTVIDDSNLYSYKMLIVNLEKKKDGPCYVVRFVNVASGTSGNKKRYIKKYKERFIEATNSMKLRIEDVRGEYKTTESEFLSSYPGEVGSFRKIKIKLEKK